MTKANLPSGLLGKVLKRGTRVLRLAQAKVCFCSLSLRKNHNKKNRKVKGKKNTTQGATFFFKGKVNRQKLFYMTSSRSTALDHADPDYLFTNAQNSYELGFFVLFVS